MESFTKKHILGKGSSSIVYLVQRKIDQQLYALKQINMAALDQAERNRALNEVRLLASIRHPNIIRYKECFFNESKQILNIVTEYAECSDLSKKIKKYKKQPNMHIPQEELWRILTDISKGLQHLHKRRILHRDIKPANILESATGYKIADLDTSKVVQITASLTHTQIGTPFYSCPESWKREGYNNKCDIWSLGVVMYELASLKVPFLAQSMKQLGKRILEMQPLPLSDYYSEFLRKLIGSMLSKNELDRPPIQHILDHCQMYQIVKKETQQDGQPTNLLDTIVFDNDVLDWKKSLPMSKFSPIKTNNVQMLRRNSQKENMQTANFGLCFQRKKSSNIENCPSANKLKEIIALDLKQISTPRRKLSVYQANPIIKKRNSVNYTPNQRQSSKQNQQQSNNISVMLNREKQWISSSRIHNKKLPIIQTERNANKRYGLR